MKSAVIFGATGQDASYLAELLLGKGYRVLGVRRRSSTPNDGRVRHLRDNPLFRLVEGDVTDPLCVWRLLHLDHSIACAGLPVEVYNLAAQSHVGTSFQQPRLTSDVSYVGCLNILEAIRSSPSRRLFKFYQASSSEMFGASCSARWPGDGGVVRHYDARRCPPEGALEASAAFYQDESTPFVPCSPYAVAKLAAHHLVRVYREAYGVFACAGILFNHESERRGEEFVTRKISKYVGALVRGGGDPPPPLRLGNLAARRDWGHAEDYVRVMWLMLQRDAADDYVVATGETHSVEDFVRAAFLAGAGIRGRAAPVALPELVVDPDLLRPNEVPLLRGDASRARRELGWTPEVGFERLVTRMVYSDVEALK